MTTQFERPPVDHDQEQDRDRDRAVGAVSVRGRPVRKAPLGWLPWAALALLGILALVSLLIARNVGDAGDKAGVDLTDNAAAKGQDPPGPDANANDGGDAGGDPDTAPTTAAPAAPATSAPAPAAAAAPAPAEGTSSIVAGGRALLPVPGSGLASLAGQAAEGRTVLVESVVADEGFWVGDDATNRIFVFLSDTAKAAEGESPFQVKAGQRVNFAGTIKPLPDDLTPFGVEKSEGAEQLRSQGHYIELTRVELSS
jgi:hypothetical protein